MRAPVIRVPEDAREAVAEIVRRNAEWREAIRAMSRHERPTGAMADEIFAMNDAKTALEDALRRRYFPRAALVTVDQWSVYTWSPTGRVVRQVWKIDPVPAHEIIA